MQRSACALSLCLTLATLLISCVPSDRNGEQAELSSTSTALEEPQGTTLEAKAPEFDFSKPWESQTYLNALRKHSHFQVSNKALKEFAPSVDIEDGVRALLQTAEKINWFTMTSRQIFSPVDVHEAVLSYLAYQKGYEVDNAERRDLSADIYDFILERPINSSQFHIWAPLPQELVPNFTPYLSEAFVEDTLCLSLNLLSTREHTSKIHGKQYFTMHDFKLYSYFSESKVTVLSRSQGPGNSLSSRADSYQCGTALEIFRFLAERQDWETVAQWKNKVVVIGILAATTFSLRKLGADRGSSSIDRFIVYSFHDHSIGLGTRDEDYHYLPRDPWLFNSFALPSELPLDEMHFLMCCAYGYAFKPKEYMLTATGIIPRHIRDWRDHSLKKLLDKEGSKRFWESMITPDATFTYATLVGLVEEHLAASKRDD